MLCLSLSCLKPTLCSAPFVCDEALALACERCDLGARAVAWIVFGACFLRMCPPECLISPEFALQGTYDGLTQKVSFKSPSQKLRFYSPTPPTDHTPIRLR